MHMPFDPPIPPLSYIQMEIYLTYSFTHVGTVMYAVALLILMKNWKPLECPSIGDWPYKL
jgi:hypothetical protein